MAHSGSHRAAADLRRRRIRDKGAAAARAIAGSAEPRFVADVMLGRLATWLRIAGFDVLYSNRFCDEELVELARRERRILLSRDTHLVLRPEVELFIFVESDRVREQLRHGVRAVGTLPGALSRCLRCNLPLADVDRERVRGDVPDFVFATQARFRRCAGCGKTHGAGTHRDLVSDRCCRT